MLPSIKNKKRMRQGLTVEQKNWACEQKSKPAITYKNLALLFIETFNVSVRKVRGNPSHSRFKNLNFR